MYRDISEIINIKMISNDDLRQKSKIGGTG